LTLQRPGKKLAVILLDHLQRPVTQKSQQLRKIKIGT
jgi:hypothetical protein